MAGNDSENTNEYITSTQGYNTASVLQIRLNTDPVVRKIQLFLTGEEEIELVDSRTGEVKVQTRKVGHSYANSTGIQGILNIILLNINPQTVQGNLKEEWYNNHVAQVRFSLMRDMAYNFDKWEIQEEYYEFLCDHIMELIEIYLTRPIENKERESYSTLQHRDVQTVVKGNNGGLFGGFKGGN